MRRILLYISSTESSAKRDERRSEREREKQTNSIQIVYEVLQATEKEIERQLWYHIKCELQSEHSNGKLRFQWPPSLTRTRQTETQSYRITSAKEYCWWTMIYIYIINDIRKTDH